MGQCQQEANNMCSMHPESCYSPIKPNNLAETSSLNYDCGSKLQVMDNELLNWKTPLRNLALCSASLL